MVPVLCCAFAIRAIVLWWCYLYFICSRRVFGMVSDGFQAQKRGSWIPSKECWQMRSRLMGERSGRANSVQNRMCGRSGVAGDVTMISQWAAREVQAGAAKSGEWSTGSSKSSGRGRQKSSKPGS